MRGKMTGGGGGGSFRLRVEDRMTGVGVCTLFRYGIRIVHGCSLQFESLHLKLDA